MGVPYAKSSASPKVDMGLKVNKVAPGKGVAMQKGNRGGLEQASTSNNIRSGKQPKVSMVEHKVPYGPGVKIQRGNKPAALNSPGIKAKQPVSRGVNRNEVAGGKAPQRHAKTSRFDNYADARK